MWVENIGKCYAEVRGEASMKRVRSQQNPSPDPITFVYSKNIDYVHKTSQLPSTTERGKIGNNVEINSTPLFTKEIK